MSRMKEPLIERERCNKIINYLRAKLREYEFELELTAEILMEYPEHLRTSEAWDEAIEKRLFSEFFLTQMEKLNGDH